MLKEIWRGADWLGRLVAGAAAFSMLLHARPVPVSDWLEWGLALYRSVFHGLLDNTIGLALSPLGLALPAWAKDPILVYGILTASIARALLRVFLADDDEDNDPPSRLKVLWAAAFWPVLLPFGYFALSVLGRAFPEEEGSAGNMVRILAPAVARELLIVFAIMALLLVLATLRL